MNTKRESICPGTKQKCEMILIDKQMQEKIFRQNDRLEQWVTDRAVKVEVLGSIPSRNRMKIFFFV